MYMDIKQLIESVIHDLSSNVSIDNIMLKTQTIAYYLKDKDFKQWVICEQMGYTSNDVLPDYRKVCCQVRIDFQQGLRIISNFEYPLGLVDDRFRDLLFVMTFYESLSEIEQMGKDCETLSKSIPAFLYKEMNKAIYGDIHGARQCTSATTAMSIVAKVKSRLLDFFMQLDDKMGMGIDFGNMENSKEVKHIMNQTIYAGILNSGSGTVNANESTTVGGKDNHVGIDDTTRKEIQSLVEQIKNIKLDLEADEKDAASYIYEIQQELDKKITMPNVIKKSLRALKGFAEITADKMVSTGIDKLMMQL